MLVVMPVSGQARGETAGPEQAKQVGSGQVGQKKPLVTLNHAP